MKEIETVKQIHFIDPKFSKKGISARYQQLWRHLDKPDTCIDSSDNTIYFLVYDGLLNAYDDARAATAAANPKPAAKEPAGLVPVL